jgi:hypothetical protein
MGPPQEEEVRSPRLRHRAHRRRPPVRAGRPQRQDPRGGRPAKVHRLDLLQDRDPRLPVGQRARRGGLPLPTVRCVDGRTAVRIRIRMQCLCLR